MLSYVFNSVIHSIPPFINIIPQKKKEINEKMLVNNNKCLTKEIYQHIIAIYQQEREMNMSDLKILNISGVDCYEKDGTVYLKLDAVARGLGFTKKADSGNEVVNWTRVRGYLADLGVVQKCTTGDFIPENIFYRLAMKAKNETAERFQAKVADEIIPSIRKTGGYIAGQETMTDDELLEKAILVAQRKIAERDKIIECQRKKIDQDKPKTIFADAVSASHTSILIGDLAKLICQNGIKIGQKRLFQWLRKNGYLVKSGDSYNMPMQRYMEQGLFEVKESNVQNPDGSIRTTKTTKVTGKGQIYFVNKFINNNRKENQP